MAHLGLWQHRTVLCLCLHVAFSECVCVSAGIFPCVQTFSLLLGTPVIGLWPPPLIQYDFILTNDICKEPVSKHIHFLRFWVDMNLRGFYWTQGIWHERLWEFVVHSLLNLLFQPFHSIHNVFLPLEVTFKSGCWISASKNGALSTAKIQITYTSSKEYLLRLLERWTYVLFNYISGTSWWIKWK